MSERKQGFYFVQHPAHEGWLTAMVDDCGRWSINGYGKYLDERSFEVVGPRIPTPDEPWQCVPREPTEEMLASAWNECGIGGRQDYIESYVAMLFAAPKPEGSV